MHRSFASWALVLALGSAPQEVDPVALWHELSAASAAAEWVRAYQIAESSRQRVDPAHPYYPFLMVWGADAARRARRFSGGLELVRALEGVDGPAWRCYALAHRGWLHLEAGRVDLARGPIEDAARIAETLDGNPDARRTAWFRLNQLDLARARPAAVVARAEQWLADADLYPRPSEERADLLFDLAQAYEHLELLDPSRERRAEATFRRVGDALEGIDDDGGRRTRARIARVALALDRGDVAEAGALLDGLDGAELDLDQETELVAARAELAIAMRATRWELEELRGRVLEILERRLPRAAPEPGGRGPLHYRVDRAPLVALLRLDRAFEGGDGRGARESLEWIARIQATGALALRVGAVAPDVDAVRAALTAEGAGVLVLLTYRRASHWIALDDELTTFSIPGTHQLRELSRRYREALAVRDPRAAEAQRAERAAAADLAEALLPAALRARMASWSAVTFVGLELLGPMPVEWLPFDEERDLWEVLPIEHSPSLPFAVAMARQPFEPVQERDVELALVVSDPAPEVRERWDVDAVAFSARDERALTRAYGDRARVRLDAIAWDPACVVLQVLAHGVRPEDGWRGTELLAPDGATFGADELDALRAPPLVLLTSCSSGAGPSRAGDAGSADLAGSFLGSGARAVLVTHGALGYESAVELSEPFHLAVRRDGLAPIQALQRAIAAVAEGSDVPVQLHLGSVQLLGHAGGPVLRPSGGPVGRSSRAPIVAAGGLVLAAATLWLVRARHA